jgi:osomolarity two-component system response regulator SKN7
LLVEDDPTCRRIGSKFLYAFHCHIDSAVSHALVRSGLC